MSVDSILNAEQLSLGKDQEIDRILSCYKYDYFAILQINPFEEDQDTVSSQIKKTYRKKTLSVHPDKVSNPKAPEAFDRIKKAERVLSSIKKDDSAEPDAEVNTLVAEKDRLVAIYKDAKTRVNRPDDLPELEAAVATILESEIRLENIDKEFEQRQEVQKMEELKKIRKERELKKKMESKWEDDRDVRVKSWRDYSSKVEKKTKKKKTGKLKVLA